MMHSKRLKTRCLSSGLKECERLYQLAHYQEGIELAQQVADSAKRDGSSEVLAHSLRLMITGFRRLNRDEDALDKANSMIASCREMGDAAGQTEALLLLGQIYLDIEKIPDAVQHLEQALSMAKATGNARQTGQLYAALSEAFNRAGAVFKAEYLCGCAAQTIEDQFPGTEHTLFPDGFRQDAERSLSLALMAESRRQYEKAIYLLEGVGYYKPRIATSAEWNDPKRAEEIAGYLATIEHIVALRLGRNQAQIGELEKAEEHLTRARQLAEEKLDETVQMLAEEQLGMLRLKTSSHEAALEHFTRAVELLEGRVSKLRVEEFRGTVFAHAEELFSRAVAVAMQSAKHLLAWEFSERARARVYLNLLDQAKTPRLSCSVGELDTEYANISYRESLLHERIEEEGRKPASPVLSKLQSEYKLTRKQKANLVKEIYRRSPLDATLVEARISKVSEVAGALAEYEGLLEYYVGPDAVTYFLVSKGDITTFKAVVKRETLASLIFQYRQRIDAQHERRLKTAAVVEETAGSPGVFSQQTAEMAAVLLEPFADQIASLSHLVVVPHGILNSMPFCTMALEKEKVRELSVSYAPSASVLLALMRRSTETKGRDVIVFANPEPDVAPLPFAEDEAAGIKEIFPQAYVLMGREAKAIRFREMVSSGKIIHLACHAEFDAAAPLLSLLRLARDDTYEDSGRIEAHEIQRLEFPGSIVVLSGCKTAVSDTSAGGELMGLVRSFLVGGAAAVVACQWPVDDAATAKLMGLFYAFLREGKAVADALRLAQIQLKEDAGAEAFYWAGFGVYGNWRATVGGT